MGQKKSKHILGFQVQIMKIQPVSVSVQILIFFFIKGAGSRNVNELLSKRLFCSIFIRHITVNFHYFSQNESVILKMDSCAS